MWTSCNCPLLPLLLLPIAAVSAAPTALGVYYLTKYGYIAPTNASSFTTEESAAELIRSAVLDFQSFAGLELTGELDAETVTLMETPRCGVRDPVGKGARTRRKKRYALQGSRWQQKTLTWKISKYSNRGSLSFVEIQQTFSQAFQLWSEASNLQFQMLSQGDSNIDIRFEELEHGDGDNFDGPGGTLAHAFFPQFGGDLHMDDQETWTINSYQGTNLLQTVVHEIGHSLGLSHSNVADSVMAPFYSGYNPNLQLREDDIKAIQALYGEQKEKPRPVPQPNKGNVLCSSELKLDAMVRTVDGTSYAFVGSQYWRLTQDGIAEGFPRSIRDWAGLPETGIDTAVTWPTSRSTFFFKGDLYWKFENQNPLPGYPKTIKEGFPGIPNNLDAAFVWGGNGKIYFFQGFKFWKFDPDGKPYVRSDKYPAPTTLWDLNTTVDTVFQWDNGFTYFFKDATYWRFDDAQFRVSKDQPPFPRQTGPWWFGCSQ